MNKDTFFKRAKPTERVEIDGLGSVIIRKLTQAEVEYARKNFSAADKALQGSRYLVSRAVVDANGVQVFTDDDQAELANVDFDVIDLLATAVMKFGGLIRKDPKAPSAD